MKKQFLFSYKSPQSPYGKEYILVESETEKKAEDKLKKHIKKIYNPENFPFLEDDINDIIESIQNQSL